MNVYGGVELEPANVILGKEPFSQTVTPPPAIVAKGRVVTLIDIFAFVAHVLGVVDVGVKVYGVKPGDAVLIVAGDHVPDIPLFDVKGNVAGVDP